MLCRLKIQNYALIDTIDVEFRGNLTIITGETGAGKSIILGALQLLRGQRAEPELVTDKSAKCVVEGLFVSNNPEIRQFFIANELDYSGDIILRREVTAEGKSRAFINDTPVNLTQLKALSSLLVDIHSQFENLLLKESEFQLSVLDTYSSNKQQLDKYKLQFIKYKEVTIELERILAQQQEAGKEKDYLEFQEKELNEAAPAPGEDKKIEQELDLLNNSEKIMNILHSSLEMLNTGDVTILSLLNEIKIKLGSVQSINTGIAGIADRINIALIELKDIVNEIEALEDKAQHEPEKADRLTHRLEVIYKLEHKHGVKSADELLKVLNEISQRLKHLSSLEDRSMELMNKKNTLKKRLVTMAQEISKRRKKIIPAMEEDIRANLAALGMPYANFKISLEPMDEMASSGMDNVKFLFSANKGSELQEVEKTASGGELSRLMLVIKSLVAKQLESPTILFDEIDSGVSGKIAAKVAELVLNISKVIQVVIITHLPQIASRGNTHILVYKDEMSSKTSTHVRYLSPEERVEEIARMISMEKPGVSALKAASELLQGS